MWIPAGLYKNHPRRIRRRVILCNIWAWILACRISSHFSESTQDPAQTGSSQDPLPYCMKMDLRRITCHIYIIDPSKVTTQCYKCFLSKVFLFFWLHFEVNFMPPPASRSRKASQRPVSPLFFEPRVYTRPCERKKSFNCKQR